MKTTILAVLMLATICLAMIPLMPVRAVSQDADSMFIDPASKALVSDTDHVGDKFNITVYVNVTEDAFGWQVGMHYPRYFLKCTQAHYSAGTCSQWLSSHTGNLSETPIVIDSGALGNGSILVYESLLGTDFQAGPSTGSLFWAEFQIMVPPPKGGNFTDLFDITTEAPKNTWVKDPLLAKLPITTYDSPVTYVWIAPTAKPYMGFTAPPFPKVYDSFTHAVGLTFTAAVAIKNLDPAWFLYNASFALTWNATVIDSLGGLLNVTLASGWAVILETYNKLLDNTTTLSFTANYTGGSSGTVPVLSILFTVMTQATSPPASASYKDVSYLTFSNVTFYDPPPYNVYITPGTSEQGEVDVNALLTLPLPWLQVDPATTILGPSPVVGTMFSVNVKVMNLTSHWNTVEIQFRMGYDPAVIQFDHATQGPFMTDSHWDLYGTLYTVINLPTGDLVYPHPHLIGFDMLYPNSSSGMYDQPVLPNTMETAGVNPVLFTFYFIVLQQNAFGLGNITTYLNILPSFWPPAPDVCFYDWNALPISSYPGVNGTVIIEPLNVVGRQIDLVGGAVNDGYGPLIGAPYLQFPPLYGGQGPNHWMDIVFPQSLVYLDAYVTYNYWPVQTKLVGFEIEGPYTHVNSTGNFTLDYVPKNTYQIWAKFSSTTDACGVATYAYRMPWPCDNPDGITGVWRITATVTIADVVVMDTMLFYYERLLYIHEVSTDSYQYSHPPDAQHPNPLYKYVVDVEVEYWTHAVMCYPALFAAVIVDNLGVPVGMALYSTSVGGATFCTWKEVEFDLRIPIPKWAYAGIAYVQVSVFDKDPTIGGEPISPMFPNGPYIESPPGVDDPSDNHVWDANGTQIDIAAI